MEPSDIIWEVSSMYACQTFLSVNDRYNSDTFPIALDYTGVTNRLITVWCLLYVEHLQVKKHRELVTTGLAA